MKKNILKKIGSVVLSFTLLASLPLPITAKAAEITPISAPISIFADTSEVRVYGSLTKLENNRIQLQNSNKNDPYQNIILNISDDTLVLDAVTGFPTDLSKVPEGQTVYAYIGKTMTMSLPPIANAKIILCNIPADFMVPAYYEITSSTAADDGKSVKLITNNKTEITVTADSYVFPYLTKNLITMHDIKAGSRILVWNKMNTNSSVTQPAKIMVFPYSYRGYMQITEDGNIIIGEKTLEFKASKTAENISMLPLRKVCEAFGLIVEWDNSRQTASIYNGKQLVFETKLHSDIITTPTGEIKLLTKTIQHGKTTYVSAYDLLQLINVFCIYQ